MVVTTSITSRETNSLPLYNPLYIYGSIYILRRDDTPRKGYVYEAKIQLKKIKRTKKKKTSMIRQ